MATANDPEQLIVSSIDKGENSSSEINIVREPLLKGEHHAENYSIRSAVLPFLFPAFGGLLYGYDIGATSSATISIESASLSGISWYDLSSVQTGLITSGSLYGALIGSAVAFQIADWLGRRRELIVSALFYFLGALVTAFAPVYVILVIGRLLYGVGIGLAMHAAPMYIAETAPSQIRGQLISLKEFFIVFGMLVSTTYLPGNSVVYMNVTIEEVGSLLIETVAGWRYMYGVSAPLAVIMGIGMWWLPSSPRWILLCAIQGKGELQGLREKAICCLCQLRGAAIGDSASRQVDDILSELSQLSEEKEATIGEMLQGKCLKALTIGAGLILFQQITGQPSVLYYAAKIFQDAGFSAAADATRASVFLALLKLIMTAVAVVVIDKLGRRPLLLGGVSGIAMSLFLLGSYYTFLGDVPAVAVTALLLYVGCYQLSFGPIGWLMISEIFPLRVRGRGLSITVLVNFGANALVAFAFSPLQDLLGAGTVFFIFGGIAVLSLVFIFFIIPETKGLTLEEIEAKYL
ncbi:D-xylose-proton symporter-like 2 isoform X1 [Solanum tuberosum]|uniref:D-xylose-proton symporter-like 2 isoform X1 n=1 Tax=Solanum tuberosum TaxID=4113 RepID=UPI00073A4ECD|nr:PREDICTED: D-xylose-proton symporter-like 2 isoform X1 [Solanum tuberosum]